MVPLRQSLTICEEYLAALDPAKESGWVVVVRAELRRGGWLFHYQSKAFVDSGNWLDALGGNLPLLVTRDGQVKVVALDEDIDEVAGPSVFTA